MMRHRLNISIICAFCCIIITQPFPVTEEIRAALYLQKFGYLHDSTNGRTGSLTTGDTISNALKDFQRFSGLNQTGVLDRATIAMMSKPRCGVKDRIGHSDSTRKKRYALQGSKWRMTRLTYRITKYPSRVRDRIKVDEEIAKAFKVWSDVAPLSFTERKRGRVDIEIRFERREHGDDEPFEGPGNTLAHAFFPQYGGNAHFDDEEEWTIGESSGTDIFQVAAHEFGHSLGLQHTDELAAIMTPHYKGYDPSFEINTDDIKAIQTLYGSKGGSESPAPEEELSGPAPEEELSGPAHETNDVPDVCQDGTIDAATRTQNGNSYLFKGDYYWRVLDHKIADGYPRKIKDDWSGLEGNLDATLTWSNGMTYFFKGRYYWKFKNKVMEPGYPRRISQGFEGIPDKLDAAFVWGNNGKTYFFKGDKYWRFDSNNDPPVSSKYPQPISKWTGLPNNIDAAFQFENSKSYFFKGDRYYRFDDSKFNIDTEEPAYPRLTSVWWFFCKTIPQET